MSERRKCAGGGGGRRRFSSRKSPHISAGTVRLSHDIHTRRQALQAEFLVAERRNRLPRRLSANKPDAEKPRTRPRRQHKAVAFDVQHLAEHHADVSRHSADDVGKNSEKLFRARAGAGMARRGNQAQGRHGDVQRFARRGAIIFGHRRQDLRVRGQRQHQGRARQHSIRNVGGV